MTKATLFIRVQRNYIEIEFILFFFENKKNLWKTKFVVNKKILKKHWNGFQSNKQNAFRVWSWGAFTDDKKTYYEQQQKRKNKTENSEGEMKKKNISI